MEEIKHAQHQREYERGLRPDPPAPLNRPKPVFSNHQISSHLVTDREHQAMASMMDDPVTDRLQSNLKEKSTSSYHPGQATNRTTVPSQINGGNAQCDQSTTSMLLQD